MLSANNWIGRQIPVLDHGSVTLLDKMGDDYSPVHAAKVSYNKADEEISLKECRRLIRYLMRHRHSTPFEMVEFKFLIRCPLFVARQWHRHRTWSYNEISGRYTELPTDCYTPSPEEWRKQSSTNKQGSEEGVIEYVDQLTEMSKQTQGICRSVYENKLSRGVARELSRCDLPLSTYTEFYAKVDLANLLHFISLRSDSHAQYEIKVYSDVILHEIIQPLFPLIYEAFIDYRMKGMLLSRLDQMVISLLMNRDKHPLLEVDEVLEQIFDNNREKEECFDKLVVLGIV